MFVVALALALQTAPAPAPAAPPAPVVEPAAEDETEFFAMFDTDKDGTISKAEFDAMSAKIDAEAAKQDPEQKGQVAAGLATALTLSAWPDLIAAAGIAVLNADSAGDILKAARAEWRAAKAASENPIP